MPDPRDTIPDRGPRTKLGVGDISHKPPPDLVGQIVLERYRVEALLGSGAMGSVFRGMHTKLERGVALKVLHAHHVGEPVIVERFRREAKIAARLSHPNVVAVLDVGEHHGTLVMILELAQGPTLRALMTGPLPAARVVEIVGALLRGLDHAHGAGLIHRDLKPENVIVEITPDDRYVPRIVDFGIATLRDPDETIEGGKLTASGMIIGTPIYMAPEQAKADPIDHRVDLFALGVMTYEMLGGEPPFTGSAMEIALANIHKEPPPIAERSGASVDPLLEAYARKLMARDAKNRFATAADALGVLELTAHDREGALLALGKMDIAKALATISLP